MPPLLLLLLAAALFPTPTTALQCYPTSSGLCYSDESGPRALNSTSPISTTSASDCATTCGSQGYSYAGLTGHTTPSPPAFFCYCGTAIVPGASPAPFNQCNLPCPGNTSQVCGANYRLIVYGVVCDGPIPKPLAPGPSCTQPEVASLPFCDTSLPLVARVSDLVGRITLQEIGPQLTARFSPAIPRLGVNAFYWGVNNVHGITNAVNGGELCTPGGKCATIWPSGPALGASFNATLYRAMGHYTGVEMRAFNNINWGPSAHSPLSWTAGMDGLSCE